MSAVRITVVRRLSTGDVFGETDPGCTSSSPPRCSLFEEGQVFIADIETMPEGFCPGAWADIFRFVCGLQAGADYPWVNEPGTALVACNDGFRPVIFRLERINEGDSNERR